MHRPDDASRARSARAQSIALSPLAVLRRGGRWLRPKLLILRLDPFDPGTAAGRSKERYRRAALSTAASSIAKGIALLTTAVSIPLTLGYLGSERFGMWMTLSAMITMLSFANLGIGNSLLNAVAYAAGLRDRALIRGYVTSGITVLVAVALSLGAGFMAIYPSVPWAALFNVDSAAARQEAGPAAAAFVACFLIGMPAGALQQARVGLQQEYVNAIFLGVGNVTALLLLIVAIQLQLGLPWLVLAMAGAPILAALANGLVLLLRSPWIRPAPPAFRLVYARALLRVGLLFLVLQLATAVAFASDSLVLAHVIGPSAVAEYAVVARLFSIPMLMVSLALGPLWPAYREALGRGDAEWLRMTFRRSIRVALAIAVPVSTILVLVGVPLIDVWVGTSALRPPFGLVFAFGVWTILSSLGSALAVLLNGIQVVRFQVITAILMATTGLLLSIALTSRIGVAGVIWGSVIAYSICSLIPAFLYLRRLFDRLESAARLPGGADDTQRPADVVQARAPVEWGSPSE